MRRLLLSFVIPGVLAGCVYGRPAVVEPQYVARCPAGYRYDGTYCQRIYAEEPARVEVEIR